MKTKNIIILLIILIIVFYIYKNYNEHFMPLTEESTNIKDYSKYGQVGKVYRPFIKKPYTECAYGAKSGEQINISECIENKKKLRQEISKMINDELKKKGFEYIDSTQIEKIETFKSIPPSDINNIDNNNKNLTPEEYQFGYYKIFNDLEEVNKNQYNQLNLPIGNYNTATDKLLGDVNGCGNCVGSPETYYLKYNPEQLKSLNSIANIQGSNISDYDSAKPVVYENDNLTGNKNELLPKATNETSE